jgi:hypothetical protein
MTGTKLAKLLRLLASDKPGEVTAAVSAINRTLQTEGLDIHVLAEAIERSPLVPQHDVDAQSWRATRLWCAKHAEFLSAREQTFISDLARWRGQPTEKQLNWLLLIEQKIRDRQAR